MNGRKKLFYGRCERWIAVMLVVVMGLLQPCTVLADSGVRYSDNMYDGQDNETVLTEDNQKERETERESYLESEEGGILGVEETSIESEISVDVETEELSEAETEITLNSETVVITDTETEQSSDTELEISSVGETEKKTENGLEIPPNKRGRSAAKIVARVQETEKLYKVNFIADNVVVNIQMVESGECAQEPAVPEKLGYTFLGWTGDYTRITSDRSVYANYIKGDYVTYRVAFVDDNERIINNPQYVVEGRSAENPSAPSRKGYTFIGWDKDWGIVNGVREDRTVKALYREGEYKTYIVSYYGRRNGEETKRLLKYEWVVEGEDGVPPELEEVEGYTFAGWGRYQYYTNVRGNQRIEAMYYQGKYKTHSVEFVDYDGRALQNPQYIIDGQTADNPGNPKKTGYTFIGWDKEFYRIIQPMKIQACYREGIYTTYPVYFYGKITGSSSWHILKTEYVPAGESAHPPMLPFYSGYAFHGWVEDYSNISKAQSVYAQYDKTQGAEKTYTVEFWSGGKLLKTEIVAEGGNATPPSAMKLKGFSFAGWNKSYVNISSRARSGEPIIITAQYQLTTYFQNSMNLNKLLEALVALQLPGAVETEIYMFGGALALPFDGIVLDILVGAALVGTIWYYWDEIKYKWDDIKDAFIEFAGADAGNEIIEDIEKGLEDAGEGEEETDSPEIKYPGNDPKVSPGEGWEWRGPSDKGSWYNPNTGESLRPDLDHPEPIGPHWDYKDPNGIWYRLNPDGSLLPKH